MPSASSRARPPGFLSSGPPGMMTIGRSATGRSRPRTIASASGEPSRSSHVDTSRLRASTSSSRRVSGSNLEPIRVRPAPRRIRIECRSRKVRKIRSLRPGSWAMTHAQLRGGNRQDPPGRGGHRGQIRTLPGEHADLAQELGPAVPGDERGAGPAIPLDDLGGAVQHHDQVISLVPVGEQHLASSHVTLGAVPAQHLQLAGVQGRGPPRRGGAVGTLAHCGPPPFRTGLTMHPFSLPLGADGVVQSQEAEDDLGGGSLRGARGRRRARWRSPTGSAARDGPGTVSILALK